jgi:uncharacterized protein (DUF362 family)/Pyruvate/2-oxoacid:ferredoxin oxidoreductase delta subunit
MTTDSNSEKIKVALISCATYDVMDVDKAVRRGLELIGGISHFINPGEKIVVKPNVLFGTAPEKCVCTHPSVFKAVGQLLLKAGVIVTYGDSSAFGSCEANVRKAGLKQVAEEIGVELADFDKGRVVVRDEAMMNKRFVIANGVLDADGLVSLPKLKTHEFTVYTGAVKNQYGCIPGVLKNQQHARFRSPQDFAAMLVDLNMIIKPRFYVMDAIMAMEGNGPRSGSPRKLGVLLFSGDPLALDTVACRLINLDCSMVPTFAPGEKAGLGTCRKDDIEIVGENIEDFVCSDFKVMRKRRSITPDTQTGKGVKATLRRLLSSFVKREISQRPVIDKTKCTVCGTCVRYCPVVPKAVNWYRGNESRPPVHDYNLCIRCFCCQEYCPEGAISVSEPLLGRFLFRLYDVVMR